MVEILVLQAFSSVRVSALAGGGERNAEGRGDIGVGQVTRRSADGGIDGIINEDKLGLDVIYIQAKRWDQPVGRPEIQKFAGALLGKKAKKGVFITTSSFTSEAIQYAKDIESRIILIDGVKLSEFMIENNVGVSLAQSYSIKRIDSDYFLED